MTRRMFLAIIFLCGCASFERDCTSCTATTLGSDWLVVQISALDGKPIRCWQLSNASLDSEERSDGINWKDTVNGNMVHISGFYNYVQVRTGQWDTAFRQLGLTEGLCKQLSTEQWKSREGL